MFLFVGICVGDLDGRHFSIFYFFIFRQDKSLGKKAITALIALELSWHIYSFRAFGLTLRAGDQSCSGLCPHRSGERPHPRWTQRGFHTRLGRKLFLGPAGRGQAGGGLWLHGGGSQGRHEQDQVGTKVEFPRSSSLETEFFSPKRLRVFALPLLSVCPSCNWWGAVPVTEHCN